MNKPQDILGNVIAHDLITYKINGQPDKITLQALQSARDEAENYRESAIRLQSERDEAVALLRRWIDFHANVGVADEARSFLVRLDAPKGGAK